MQTAAELNIQRLYRYQGFHLDWLQDTIHKNKIFISTPASFNDPWDCKPHFHCNVDDPKIKKDVLSFYTAAHEKHGSKGNADHIKNIIDNFDSDPESLKKFMDKNSAGITSDINTQYRVCCLTTKPDNSLMWSHYAEKHTGVCLEFEVQNEVFSTAVKVEYQTEYPPFQMTAAAVGTNVKALTTKSQDWGYEEEYRLIALEKSKLSIPGMLSADGNWLTIPENSLLGIITGCQMDDTHKKQIEELVEESGKSIQIKEALRIPNAYNLKIVDKSSIQKSKAT